MAPRRGGDGGAGALVALGAPRSSLDQPPLKRSQPWLQNGAGQCEIIAGAVDDTGIFKGIHMSGVHLMALLRTFQLSKIFMPVDTSTPLASLGQSLQDGIPLVIVTRGCFGRELDYGPGPARNALQKSIWEICRTMRAEMSQVLITCIDLPINVSSDVVQACSSAPLNEYRELMYHEGTWYAPTVISSTSLSKWKAEHKREKLSRSNGQGVSYNRKKFGWIDDATFYQDMWTLGWKAVLKKVDPPVALHRTDLVFTTEKTIDVAPIEDSSPSAAEVTFRKLLVRGRESRDPAEVMSHVKAYLDRAKFSEKQCLEEAVQACNEAARMFDESGKHDDAVQARGKAVGIYIWMNELTKALQMAQGMQTSASAPKFMIKATRLVIDCHFALGELDKALEVASSAKNLVQGKDQAVLCEAWGMVVSTNIAMGDFESAVAAAKSATSLTEKEPSAKAWLLVAEAEAASASNCDNDADKLSKYDATISAYGSARALFTQLGSKKEEAEAVQAICNLHLTKGDPSAAEEVAIQLEGLTKDTSDHDLQILAGVALQLTAMAHIQQYGTNGSFLKGGGEAMLASARGAVAAFDALGDSARRASAQRVLLQAIRAHSVTN